MIDNDGVLADFDRHVIDLFGQHPNSDDELWDLVDGVADFWLTMPVMFGAHKLWEFIQPYDPIILTGCPRRSYEFAASQKVLWAQRHFGTEVAIITCLSCNKALHITSPEDILIDDRKSNIRRWQKAGNRAIRYRSAYQAIDDLTVMVSDARPG